MGIGDGGYDYDERTTRLKGSCTILSFFFSRGIGFVGLHSIHTYIVEFTSVEVHPSSAGTIDGLFRYS